MDKYGYLRVGCVVPKVELANPRANAAIIIENIEKTQSEGVEVLVFPELSVTGYTCGDLFGQRLLLDEAEKALSDIAKATEGGGALVMVGAPLRHRGELFNCAVAICGGRILGAVPKTHLPNYGEFYEKRWFTPGAPERREVRIGGAPVPLGTHLLFNHRGTLIGAEVCEDLWVENPPSVGLAMAGASLIVNLSASDEVIGKHEYLLSLIKNQSARLRCAYAYSSAGDGESSTDLVFAGNAIIAENGRVLASSPRFAYGTLSEIADVDIEALEHDRQLTHNRKDSQPYEIIDTGADSERDTDGLRREVNAFPFVPASDAARSERCSEVISIQTWGLARRLKATGCRNVVVGVSGGLDSTLALLICVEAFKRLGLPMEGIHAITMPGFGTTGRTYHNAVDMMKHLGVSVAEIPIGAAVRQHFNDIGHNPEVRDVTYENCQARERTQILMDYANKVNGMVIGTGDMSELALGWCTYNGDQMSMYGVNASVPKTLVKHLVTNIARDTDDEELRAVLMDIVDTPISPELIPADEEDNITQKTEDLVGPYELHDFFLYNVLRYGYSPAKIFMLASEAFGAGYPKEVIKHWLRNFYRRFFAQQFKRSCMPDGPKTGSVCLSPRGDWRMPSDAVSKMWLEEVDEITLPNK